MRRSKWSHSCKKWLLEKVSKVDQQHTTFFALIYLYHWYIKPSQLVQLFKCKLVGDNSKTLGDSNGPECYYGTWNRTIPNRYFYVPTYSIISLFFTIIMLCSCYNNHFSLIDNPCKTLGKLQFQSKTYMYDDLINYLS